MKGKFLIMIDHLFRFERGLLSFLLFPAFALAQAVQPCVVKQYNQKDAKTPLAGVLVEVRGAGTKVSDAQGVLTLNFTTLKPGDRVVKRGITKDGYEIFNTSAVEQWTISRDRTPFQIVLVRSDYMRQLKQTLRDNSLENYKLKYEQTKKQLKKEQEAGKLKDEEYRKEMEKLENQYDNALKDLDNYIDQFAHFDLNEVSTEEQRILDMVQKGQIDEAVKAYENLQLSEKLLQERADLKKLDEASARIEEEKARKEENISALRDALDREITTLKLAGGRENFEKIAQILKEQALADTTDYEAVKEYAFFSFIQRDYSESLRYYLICLQLVKGDTVREAGVYGWLGNIYGYMHNHTEEEKCRLTELDYRTKIYEQDPSKANLNELSIAQTNVGNIYRYKDTVKAEYFLKLGLENVKKLISYDDSKYRASYFGALMMMGQYYWTVGNYTKAKEYCEEAIALGELLCQLELEGNNSLIGYCSGRANLIMLLANCYTKLHDYVNAEKFYIQSLEEFQILAPKNPKVNLLGLALIQNEIANLYEEMGEYEKKQKYSIDALNSYYTIFQWDSSMSRRRAIESLQTSIGIYYQYVNYNYAMAEQYYLAALRHINILMEYDSTQYLSHLAIVQKFLGDCYYESGNFIESEKYYLAALGNYGLLSKIDTAFKTKSLVDIQKNLGNIFYSREDFANAETYYLLVLENKLVLMQQDTSAYCLDVANLELAIARINAYGQNNEKAERYYLSALEHCTWLYAHDTTYSAGMAMIYNELSYCYARADRFPQALNTIEKAISLYSADPTYYDSKGEILLMSGNEKGALEMWQKVLELDPDFLKHLEENGSVSELYKGLKEKGLVK